jgi:hypothetical protein
VSTSEKLIMKPIENILQESLKKECLVGKGIRKNNRGGILSKFTICNVWKYHNEHLCIIIYADKYLFKKEGCISNSWKLCTQ